MENFKIKNLPPLASNARESQQMPIAIAFWPSTPSSCPPQRSHALTSNSLPFEAKTRDQPHTPSRDSMRTQTQLAAASDLSTNDHMANHCQPQQRQKQQGVKVKQASKWRMYKYKQTTHTHTHTPNHSHKARCVAAQRNANKRDL